MDAPHRTTFFSLPTELRLQIAAYVLEQPKESRPTLHLMKRPRFDIALDSAYTAASNLSVLLVCRQFHHDFTELAYQMTKFILTSHNMQAIYKLPDEKRRSLRKLVINSTWEPLARWQDYPFDNESLHLDELGIVTNETEYQPVLGLLRRLRNVKTIKIFSTGGEHLILYGRFVGAMQKDDHYQRYDAPNAPNIGCTWWEPSLNLRTGSFYLVAQEPLSPIAEEDYMIMMKPKVDALMGYMAYM